MILQYEDTSTPYNGRVGGSIFTSSGRRGVGRIRNRPANARQRQRWRPPWSLAAGKAAFAALGEADQDSWNEWAADNFCWPIQGSPRFTNGELFFANSYTVLQIFTGATPTPAVPVAGPSWQTKPKFYEFAEWVGGYYTIVAETEFDIDTELIFSGLPPSKTVFNGEWFGEKMIGSDTLYSGLIEDENYQGLQPMFQSEFGTITDTMKIWGRIWEKYPDTGHIRLLKDPCTPTPTPAAALETFQVFVTNGYNDAIAYSYIDLYTADYEIIGEWEIEALWYEDTLEHTYTLPEGKTRDDIEWVAVQIYWELGPSWVENIEYEGAEPWYRILYPDE